MSGINPKIFRAYDIRGFYPQEVSEETALRIGKSIVEFLRKKYQHEKLTVVVGRDGRESSPALAKSLIEGIISMGADVVDVGLVPTPAFYFAVWNYGYDGGIYITASHNPPEYSGFKLVEKNAVLIAANTGIDQIKNLAMAETPKENEIANIGEITQKDVLFDYENFVLSFFGLEKIKPFKIAVDCANGASSVLIPKIISKIPGKHLLLLSEIDGKFSNHIPDPSQANNLQLLSQTIAQSNFDLGVAFDGDGDRVGFVDEKGEMISPNLITAFLTEFFIKEKKEKTVVYTVCMSRIISDIASELGGKSIMAKVGFTFVKEEAMKENAALGAEISGHYCLKTDHFCEGPIFVWLTILSEMSKTGKRVSEIFSEFKKYFYEGPLNYEVQDKEKTLKDLENYFQGGEVSHLDGIRIDFNDWWFNARPSNTENLLRVVIEAKDKNLLVEKKKEILRIIQGI